MFDLLKKKIGSFTDKLTKRVEEKAAPTSEEDRIKEIRELDKRELKAKVAAATKIKHVLSREIEISENDVSEFLNEFELALLESDVEQQTAQGIVEKMRSEIVGKKIAKGKDVTEFLKGELRKVLRETMSTERIDVFRAAGTKKPYVILFLGPNGAGKTTSMAKLTKAFQERGKKVVWAASDTFRAASIEQLEKHSEKLGVRVVKHAYGADPAAVAFDAISAAKAHGVDVVMIDSAGRQETNKNLVEELRKIDRVAKPDLKVYVGEAFTGQALLQQAAAISEKVGIDGFILSKIDCDAKGGTSISLLHNLHKPILFVGTGQGYNDLKEFDADFILDRIIS